ncbi:uncharacterized protein B0I36DRAFT_352729 [Microdochium trichocladiopsis]|uniref:Uncharacterized protein n=1 Tax=Microdochium trichocladiopsis TaxID=1682393 RepID=A0A9P8XX81_9PEZI|nr:uncharacterized protein B0I36DRAFT_352729 [Microdochium trichocladiopsis]KAH7024498.1 hypothetical protein B0I36DRAFT_352729 [Microdochium trichocladiopsis]
MTKTICGNLLHRLGPGLASDSQPPPLLVGPCVDQNLSAVPGRRMFGQSCRGAFPPARLPPTRCDAKVLTAFAATITRNWNEWSWPLAAVHQNRAVSPLSGVFGHGVGVPSPTPWVTRRKLQDSSRGVVEAAAQGLTQGPDLTCIGEVPNPPSHLRRGLGQDRNISAQLRETRGVTVHGSYEIAWLRLLF